MRFKTKDLMVTVLPQATEVEIAHACRLGTILCLHPTICVRPSCLGLTRHCHPCSLFVSCLCTNLVTRVGCAGFTVDPITPVCNPTIACGGGTREPWVIENLEDLVALRDELTQTLKELDAIEKEGLASGIRTAAEAEALERGLNEALDQVRKAKKNLK